MSATRKKKSATRRDREKSAPPSQGWSRTKWIVLILWVLLFLLAHLAGCGYTVLQKPAPPAAHPPAGPRELPPGHPPIDQPVPQYSDEDWEGRSLLDHIVGAGDPLRFENVRGQRGIDMPGQNAYVRLRMSFGGPALTDVWQLRIDENGWVTAARWTQGFAGPQLDEDQAAQRYEFRLDPQSAAALRVMVVAMMPIAPGRTRRIPELELRNLPIDLWAFDESGLLELEYGIETMEALTPSDWPGGQVVAPLNVIEVLIGRWDSTPPLDLQEMVAATVARQPLLVDLAMLVEGVVLAWEVEGPEGGAAIGLPLHVAD
jgi:hypothetical protein